MARLFGSQYCRRAETRMLSAKTYIILQMSEAVKGMFEDLIACSRK